MKEEEDNNQDMIEVQQRVEEMGVFHSTIMNLHT